MSSRISGTSLKCLVSETLAFGKIGNVCAVCLTGVLSVAGRKTKDTWTDYLHRVVETTTNVAGQALTIALRKKQHSQFYLLLCTTGQWRSPMAQKVTGAAAAASHHAGLMHHNKTLQRAACSVQQQPAIPFAARCQHAAG